MKESIKTDFVKTVFFEDNEQIIRVEVSLENCIKKDYKNLIPIISTLFDSIKNDLET